MSLAATFRLLLACAVVWPTLATAVDRPRPVGSPVGVEAVAAPVPAVAIAADLDIEGGKTRLIVTLSREVEARAFAMDRPDRIVVELPEVNFQVEPAPGRGKAGLVSAFRHGLFAPGRSRIVIDLAQPALVSRLDVTTRAVDGAKLLTVELTRADRDSFRKAAAEANAPAPVPQAVRQLVDHAPDEHPMIVIDPGHGGIDPGARTTAGVFEKDLVFAFAEQLRRKLDATKRFRVVMTREEDVFVSLDERVRVAQAAHADLLISIHADTISSSQVRGATVYTGSPKASDAESAQLAERENEADAAAGLDTGQAPDEVADILQDLTLRETRGFSRRFATKLVSGLDSVMRFNSNPHRQAGFRVLRAPDVPSVLVELGYLSSRKDTDLIMSEEWRAKSAAAMTEAITRFFATRIAGQGASGTRTP